MARVRPLAALAGNSWGQLFYISKPGFAPAPGSVVRDELRWVRVAACCARGEQLGTAVLNWLTFGVAPASFHSRLRDSAQPAESDCSGAETTLTLSPFKHSPSSRNRTTGRPIWGECELPEAESEMKRWKTTGDQNRPVILDRLLRVGPRLIAGPSPSDHF